MDLEARLRAFAAVARRGSFSRAADELGISQPAVSKHVADLEASLGTRLLVREPRGARLTPAGEFLAGYVGRAEALLAQAAAGMASIAGADSGTITVAASGTPAVYLLPKALAVFTAARPEVEVKVVMGSSAEAVEMVRDHRVELGVVGGGSSAPDLDIEPLIEDEIVVVGAPSVNDHELSHQELERLTWLWREKGSATRLVVEQAMSSLGLRPTRHLTLPDWEMIKIAAESKAGVAAMSRFAVEAEVADGRLVILKIPGWHIVRPLSIIRSRDVPMTPLAEHLAASLRRVVTRDGSAIDRARVALGYAERADGHASLDDIQQALRDGLDVLTTAAGDDELRLAARMSSLLAFWQVKDGDLDKAETTLDAALRRPGMPAAGLVDLRSRLGWLTSRRGDDAAATLILEDAVREARMTGNAAVQRRAMLDLATAYSGLGRHSDARDQLDSAMDRSREAGDIDELLRAYNNGMGILEAAGDPGRIAEAERFVREGLEEARRAGDRHHIAWIGLNLARPVMRRGELRESEYLVRDSLRLFEELRETGGLTPALVFLAWTRLHLGDRDEARSLAARAMAIGTVGRPWLELEWAALLATIDRVDDPSGALERLREAVASVEQSVAAEAVHTRLLMARMAFRIDAPLPDGSHEFEGAAPELPEERAFGRWTKALADADRVRATRLLRDIAVEVEAGGALLLAAEAYDDAAVMALRASRTAEARRLGRERDRLLGVSGAVLLLDPVSAA